MLETMCLEGCYVNARFMRCKDRERGTLRIRTEQNTLETENPISRARKLELNTDEGALLSAGAKAM
jgi:hypothetical protein